MRNVVVLGTRNVPFLELLWCSHIENNRIILSPEGFAERRVIEVVIEIVYKVHDV